MTALVVALGLAVALLGLLVVALLRSHAEILRRLEEREPPPARARPVLDAGLPAPAERPHAPVAHDVVGTTVAAEAVQLGLAPGGPSTLLAFLTSGCTLCQGLWEDMAAHVRPGGARVVAVTHGPQRESPGRLAELAPDDVPVVMSSAAWKDYGVPGAPYFVYVDGPSGQVHGEGAASTWGQVGSLLFDALLDADHATAGGRGEGGAGRRRHGDAALAAAGIEPDDQSLHPGSGRR